MSPFNEFNNNEVGWMCDVPLIARDGIYDSDVESIEGLQLFRKTLEDAVYYAMKDALDNPGKANEKGRKGLQRIRDMHSPSKNIEILKEIYQRV